MSKIYTIRDPDIRCFSCSSGIQSNLENTFSNDFYGMALVRPGEITVEVRDSVTPEALLEAIKECGFDGAEIIIGDPLSVEEPGLTIWPYSLRAAIAGVPGILIMILMAVGIHITWPVLLAIGLASLPVMLVAGWPIYRAAFKSIFNARTLAAFKKVFTERSLAAVKDFFKSPTLTMDSLFTLSTAIAWGASMASLFYPALGLKTFFEAGLLILGARNFGLAIEKKAEHKVLSGLKFIDRLPKTVAVVNKLVTEVGLCQTSKLDLNEVKAGQLIKLEAGDVIPVDGVITRGQANLEQSILSGDLTPKQFKKDDEVYAGMRVTQGSLIIEATRPTNESLLMQMDAKIKLAGINKPAIEELTSKIVRYFVPTVIVLSVISAAIVSLFFGPHISLITGISVLVVSCPCVLGFVVPLSVKIGINKAAKHGAYFTDGNALQKLAKVNTVVLDITGTLTTPKVAEVMILKDGVDQQTILKSAVTLEADHQHVMASAIREYAQAQQIQPEKQAIKSTVVKGCGVSGSIANKECLLGNTRLLDFYKIDYSQYQQDILNKQKEGKSVLFIVEGKQIIGMIVLELQLKPGSKEVIAQLRDKGIDVKLCSGSDQETVLALARDVGVDEFDVYGERAVFSEQTPGDKLNLIQALRTGKSLDEIRELNQKIESCENEDQKRKLEKELQKVKNHVAMVGDGGNDTLALEASHAAITMNTCDDMCRSTAGVILSDHSLQPLLHAVTVSRQSMGNIKQNLGITFSYNFVMILIAGGALLPLSFILPIPVHFLLLPPALAATLMTAQSLMVLANALRFKRKRVVEHKNLKAEFFTPAPIEQPALSTVAEEKNIYQARQGAHLRKRVTSKPEDPKAKSSDPKEDSASNETAILIKPNSKPPRWRVGKRVVRLLRTGGLFRPSSRSYSQLNNERVDATATSRINSLPIRVH